MRAAALQRAALACLLVAGAAAVGLLTRQPSFPLLLAALGAAAFAFGWRAVARYARDQREAFLPDLLRAFDYGMMAAVVMGGQVALVMARQELGEL